MGKFWCRCRHSTTIDCRLGRDYTKRKNSKKSRYVDYFSIQSANKHVSCTLLKCTYLFHLFSSIFIIFILFSFYFQCRAVCFCPRQSRHLSIAGFNHAGGRSAGTRGCHGTGTVACGECGDAQTGWSFVILVGQ